MIKDKKILINNIYHMLSYAFQTLKQENYKDVSIEPFDEMYDLFAAILSKGIGFQLKHGLYKEYINYQEDLAVVSGKINISETLKKYSAHKKVLSCNFDKFSENNLYNQTNNDLIYFDKLKKDVELAISQANLKTTGDYNINGVNVDVTTVQDVLKDVTKTQINYCVEQILKSKQITNFENYVIASLYNSVTRDKQNKINNQNSTLGKFNWWDE